MTALAPALARSPHRWARLDGGTSPADGCRAAAHPAPAIEETRRDRQCVGGVVDDDSSTSRLAPKCVGMSRTGTMAIWRASSTRRENGEVGQTAAHVIAAGVGWRADESLVLAG